MLLTERLLRVHEDAIDEICINWLAILLSPKPANRFAAAAACRLTYDSVGWADPKVILWVKSPLAAWLSAYLFRLAARGAIGEDWEPDDEHASKLIITPIARQILAEVWNGLASVLTEMNAAQRSWVFAPMTPCVNDEIRRALHDITSASRGSAQAEIWLLDREVLWDAAQATVPLRNWHWRFWETIEGKISEDLTVNLCAAVGASMRDQGTTLHLACLDALSRLGEHIGPFGPMITLQKICGGWWLFRGAAILMEPPRTLHLDDEGRLHSPDSMAIAYPDGWGVYAWHGVPVSEQLILRPEALTPKQILSERNVEIRRLMIERLGLKHFLSQARAKCLDADKGGTRLLYRLNLPGDEPLVAVRVQCPSTGQIHFLRVPPTVRTCREAVAWTFGFEKEQDYVPMTES